jgi:hypothetical protein
MALNISRVSSGFPLIWDNTNAFDYRTLEATWLLSSAMTTLLVNIAKDTGKGRDANVDIILTSGCGFYPFGPDKGDAGTFRARIISVEPEATIGHPQDYFKTTVCFRFNGSYPSYSYTQFTEGALRIGDVTGLRWPDDYHKQHVKYDVMVNETADGTAYANDRTSAADIYETELSLVLTQGKMAALVAQMIATRGSDINVIPPANSYFFGIENASTATYVCKSLKQKLEIIHNNYQNFSIDLHFYRISG